MGSDTRPVTVVVTRGATGTENVDVYFHAADGTLVAKVPTDANGRASQVMEAGGYVTAVDPYPALTVAPHGVGNFHELVTFAAVKPGDVLLLPDSRFRDYVNLTYSAPVSSLASASYLGFGSKQGDGGSFGPVPTGTVTVQAQSAMDAMVVATNGLGSIEFMTSLNVTPTNDTVTFAGAYTAGSASTFAITNVPAEITSGNFTHIVGTPRGLLASTNMTGTTNSGAFNLSATRPFVAGTTDVLFGAFDKQGTDFGRRVVVDWKPTSLTQSYDYATALLAPFDDFATFSVSTHAVTWSEGTGAAGDTVVTSVSAGRTAPSTAWEWTMIAPKSGETSVYPVLPAEIATFNPVASDTVNVTELVTYKVPGGYDSLRPSFFAFDQISELPVVGSGQASEQRYEPPTPK